MEIDRGSGVGEDRPMKSIRVHRIAYSTNVERVALACGIKGVEVEWIDHPDDDRAAVIELSGQPLVPVAEIDGEVFADSIRILERLELVAPGPPLYPDEPAARASAEVFVEWFDRVWKGPPNALDDDPRRDDAHELRWQMSAWTDRFEAIFGSRPFLLGDELTVADVCAYPFLRYAVHSPEPDDVEPFHEVLHAELPADDRPALAAWVARIAALPQA